MPLRDSVLRTENGVIDITGSTDPPPRSLVTRARQSLGDRAATLRLAQSLGNELPLPGHGRTAHLWSALATLGAVDLTLARTIEPHLDAAAIIDQACADDLVDDDLPSGSYGVFAAEGPGHRLSADGSAQLSGSKPWCSLAGSLDAALVTAWTGGERGLFAVKLDSPGVTTEESGWFSRGLVDVPSLAVHFDKVPATPVGPPGWYLQRPGFAWGGIGVAAIWFGAAVALGRRLVPRPGGREPDQIALLHLGEVEMQLAAAASVLAEAASLIDSSPTRCLTDPARLALITRGVVARVAADVLARVARASGPGPLTGDEEHARRVADLSVYVRQEHAERDAAALGAALLA